MSLINRVPQGLLSLLGIKAGGVNPSVLPQEVQPSLDLLELYLSGVVQQIIATGNIAAVGSFTGFAALTVPETEVWYVRSLTCLSPVLTAGQALLVTPAVSYSNAGTIMLGPQSNLGAAGDFVCVGSSRPFIVTQGGFLGLIVNRLTAGPVNGVQLTASVARLSI